MRHNFSQLALVLVIFAAVFLPSTRSGHSTSAGRVAADLVETTAGRVYASPDGVPASWEQGEGTGGLTVYALASDPESPNVYAGVWGDGVYRAFSGENSWWQTPLGFPTKISSLTIDPVRPSIVYAGTMGHGIFRSDSGSGSWGPTTVLEGKDVWSLAVTSTLDSIYAYAGTAGEIYTSTNGIDWDLTGGTEIGTEKFYALVVDPQDSRTAYVGTKEKGVYRTTDGGLTWTPRGLHEKTVRALALHPDDSEIIYAGTQSHGIFKSTDGGASWPSSALNGYPVLAIAINRRNPEFVYAGTYGGGVWVSYDGGYNWHEMSGLTDGISRVYSLTLFTPEGGDDCTVVELQYNCQVLYAGTTDGVWARAVTLGIIYVKADASGANNGTSWADAYIDLQTALADAHSGDEIWVAAGTYKPTTDTSRTATFQLKSGVALYGGFAGGETARDQRDWETNVTILSGDIGTPRDNSDNSYHVVTGSGTDATAVLDGFTVTSGKANGDLAWGHDSGGGIYNSYGNPTLTNCIFSGNSVTYNGGGMYNVGSDPTLTHCTFSDNSAYHEGGGIYNGSSSPMVTSVTFSDNYATYSGGGMHNGDGSSPTVTDCTFSGNFGSWGGGMYNWNSDPMVTNCTFSDNSVSNYGGGMENARSNPTVTNCTFSGNSALGGGGMLNSDGNPTVTNCTFSGNSATHDGGGMYNHPRSNPTLTNCTFSSNSATDNGGGIYNWKSDPTLSNVTFSSNSADQGGGMYNDVDTNPMLRNTIVANSTAGGDCSGDDTIISAGYNLDSDGTCGFTGEGDLSNTDPLLGPLQDNGGPTFTHALLAGSPAIDAGNPAGCTDPWGNPLTADQRGEMRPADGDCDGILICDIGAYEALCCNVYLPIILQE
jgi:parallel beta-helix repeat protein/predicted outer membrane repeat protein